MESYLSFKQVGAQSLCKYLDEILAAGKIRSNISPAGSPNLCVPKPHGHGLRLCIDYRGLNRIMVMNLLSLPLMQEVQDRNNQAKIFIKIDQNNEYNLIQINKDDEWKTAFRACYGHFEYLIMTIS